MIQDKMLAEEQRQHATMLARKAATRCEKRESASQTPHPSLGSHADEFRNLSNNGGTKRGHIVR